MIARSVALIVFFLSIFAACAQDLPNPASPAASTFHPAAAPVYEVFALRYASIPGFPVNALIAGADPQRKLSIAMTVWLIRGNGHVILVDSGFYRPQFFKQFKVEGFLKSSEAVGQPGIMPAGQPALTPEDVTDVVITHMHFGTTPTAWTCFPRRASGCKRMSTRITPVKHGSSRAPTAALIQTT